MITVLIAEDSSEESELIELALASRWLSEEGQLRSRWSGRLSTIWKVRAKYADRSRFPFPQALVSDLKMPRFDGLQWIKDHPECTIILTSSTVTFRRRIDSAPTLIL